MLKPKGTVVEGTAGNTGIGLAHVCNARGYKCVIVMPDNQAPEKYQIIEALGAELRKVPAVPYSNPNQYQKVAGRLAAELPNAIWANQFDNTANRLAHFESTGPEIWNDTGGKIDAFCAATGTGGTLAGVAAYLKSMSPRIRIVLVDPPGSALYHYVKDGELKSDGGSSITEGIGTGRVTANLEGAPIDDALRISDAETVQLRLSPAARGRIAARKHSGHQRRGGGADSPGARAWAHDRHRAVRRRRQVSIAAVQQGMDRGARIRRGPCLGAAGEAQPAK